MIRCTFHLNGGQLSTLSCPGVGFFPAYSGNKGVNRNNPGAVSTPEVGPLPPGLYYIVTRPRGGLKSRWKDTIKELESGSNRDFWFALYRDDGHIDDRTFIDNVERGSFRLHPAGQSGISNGCITLPHHAHYRLLMHSLLLSGAMKVTPELSAFGTIQVY
ncbi:DUF2778 domain-containing protein [Leclercia adecarboxylata]|uniref:DUF2778 domain-containing protein n=1 Tax=Leclercia adecarboxylata TaxID=83655 RepID=UPI0009077EFF|nr:DUF2778 domain-containing protein [Leclercia adecarboxylata]